MSRLAGAPIVIPDGIDVKIAGKKVTVTGVKGILERCINDQVSFIINENNLVCEKKVTELSNVEKMLVATERSLLSAMIIGVSVGFEKKLQIVGVGYRAKVTDNVLDLALGFSHPVSYKSPDDITVSCPSQTEIIIKGLNKQKVGQVAADIRAYRPVEPYKGKGIRYFGEKVIQKEAKKK